MCPLEYQEQGYDKGMAQCMHLISPAESCIDCNPVPAARIPVPELWGPWFTAGYDSSCAGCGDGILAGDKIRADGQGGYLCESCGQEEF